MSVQPTPPQPTAATAAQLAVSTPPQTEVVTAAELIFSIPLILDPIVSHLDWKDLFLLQRVNRNFLSAISSSPQLRVRRNLHGLSEPPDFRRLGRISGMWHSLSPDMSEFVSPLLLELLLRDPWSLDHVLFYDGPIGSLLDIVLICDLRGAGKGLNCDEIEGGEGVVTDVPRLGEGARRGGGGGGVGADAGGRSVDPRGSWRDLRVSLARHVQNFGFSFFVMLPPVEGSSGDAAEYWEKVDVRAFAMGFGDVADILQEVTERTLDEHARICRSLGGRAGWVRQGDRNFGPVVPEGGRLERAGAFILGRSRTGKK